MNAEPEIDALGRVAHTALHLLRWIAVLAGILAIAAAGYTVYDPVPVYSDDIPPQSTVIAHQFTFVCLGLPLATPIVLWIGRLWPVGLVIGLGLGFGPMLLAGDHDYGFVIRLFATGVSYAVLAVWRTLVGLTNPNHSSGQAA
ncbi:MAG: hypothetical protein NXI31_22005 [bacterium]|nr:hypothetical protein [bacterium]